MFRPYVRVLRTRHVALLLLFSFLGSLPISMLTLAVLLLVHSSSGSFALAGVVSGSLSAGNAVGLIVQGRFIDRYGQTATLIITGLLCGVALVALTLGATRQAPLPVLVLLAAVAGASIPAVITSMRVLIPDLVTDPDLRTTGYALLGTQFQVAMITGPLLVSTLLLVADVRYAVLIAAVLAVAGGLVFGLSPASRRWRPQAIERVAEDWPSRLAALLTPGLRTILVASFGTGVAAGLASVGVPAISVAAGAASVAGLLFAAQSGGDLVGGLIYGGRRWRLPVAYRVVCCQAAAAVQFGVLAMLAGHPLGMLPVMFALGLVHAPGGIATSAILDDVAARGALGLSYTSMVAASLIGIAIGSSVAGALEGATAAWVLFAVAAVVTSAVAGQTYWRRRTLIGEVTPVRSR